MKKRFFIVAALYACSAAARISVTLNKADPVPLDETGFPFDYCTQAEKQRLMENRKDDKKDDWCARLTISPFYQRANKGSNLNGNSGVELGSLSGNWNLLALLDNSNTPNGKTFPNALTTLKTNLLATTSGTSGSLGDASLTGGEIDYAQTDTSPEEHRTIAGLLGLQTSDQKFGFAKAKMKFRKYGVRFGALFNWRDFGLGISSGVASISQTLVSVASANPSQNVTNPYNTANVSDSNWTNAQKIVDKEVTQKFLGTIAPALGLTMDNYKKNSVEDVDVEFFWRRVIKLDAGTAFDAVLFTPFVSVCGTIDASAGDDPNKPLSVPFGNNNHNAGGVTAGFTLNFDNHLEFGSAGGVMIYDSRTQENMRIPNTVHQIGIYPYTTAAKIKPGETWFLSFLMNAHHFSGKLSMHSEYIYAHHNEDTITLVNADSNFRPEQLEAISGWDSHVLNLGINYNASENIHLGIAGQVPLKRKNSYRTATFITSFNYEI